MVGSRYLRAGGLKRSVLASITVGCVVAGLVTVADAAGRTHSSTSASAAGLQPGCVHRVNGPIVQLTLAGPNQYSTSGKSFGPAWETLVKDFEACQPNVKLRVEVLPIATFYPTESTLLSAGTAPELVFNQAAYKPYMVTNLDPYLSKPNPFAPKSKTWMKSFNRFFGPTTGLDTAGHHDWVPFTLSATAVLYNKTAFAKAGVKEPIANFAQLISACGKLSKAGYAGLALDDSDPWVSWVSNVIAEMMLRKYFDQFNVFGPTGDPGTSTSLTQKDWAKAILSGQITTSTPEVAEMLTLMKQVYQSCGTPNWSGIKSNSGSMSNPADFMTGKAAMTIGTSFAGGVLKDVKFQLGSMPFPTITTETTPLSQGYVARFGVSPYGSAWMIPSTTRGAKLAAAIKFLQFATAASNNEKLVLATTGVPSAAGAAIPAASRGFVAGDWGKPMELSNPIGYPPAGMTLMSLYDGYFLGTKTLAEEQSYLQDIWKSFYQTVAKSAGWCSESWAQC